MKTDKLEIDRLSGVFADSFTDDPLMGWWDRSAKCRVAMFGAIVYEAHNKVGSVLCGNPAEALAIYEVRRFSRFLIPYQTIKSILFFVHYISFRDLERLIQASWALAKMTPDGTFLHLQYFLTSEHQRQRGHGMKLLEEIKEFARRQKLAIYLEASSPRSRDYFLRRGFLIHRIHRFRKGPSVWAMRFPPN